MIEVIQPGKKADEILVCLKGKFPDAVGKRSESMIEVQFRDMTPYNEARDRVEEKLGECDRAWGTAMRLLESSQS